MGAVKKKKKCLETDEKNLINLVSVAGTSVAVSRNEIRGGGEKVMKRERGENGKLEGRRYEHSHRRGRASDRRDSAYFRL